MQAAGGEPPPGARVTIGHRHHYSFLQPEHIVELWKIRHNLHQRQFGGARIAEEMRYALVDQESSGMRYGR